MRLLLINSCSGCLSTGRIATDIAKSFVGENENNQAIVAYARDFKEVGVETITIGSRRDVIFHKLASIFFDCDGFGSKKATSDFLKWADQYNPDVLWLHNIHGYFINVEMLFDWIKMRPQMKVMWTLHDCWSFTGHCTNFSMSKCDKWKNGCEKCSHKKDYPYSFISRSEKNYSKKKNAFTGISNLTIITPSEWLANLVKQSFLKEYPVEVRNNTIDTETFRPTESTFVLDNNLQNKKIVLGVASTWSEKKGLYDFVKLIDYLDDTFQIVLVGVTEKQKRKLPSQILAIERTQSKKQLAEIYTAASVFVNPTYEDNYPTTNLEANACGTTVITYNTGGSPESALPENVLPVGDVYALSRRIVEVCSKNV